LNTVEFSALEYTKDASFCQASYRYEGDPKTGWQILRDEKEQLVLPKGYRLLRSIRCGICSTDLARHNLPYPLPQITGHEVIAEDEVVDQLEKDIDEVGMAVMMRFNPVASDLRMVISSMSMARAIERVGDHAVNVARLARRILKIGPIQEAKMLEPLYTLAAGQFRDAIASYADGNQQLGLGLMERDQELDKLHKRLAKSLRGLIEERREGSEPLIHLLFVARSLERIGDLAVNLGEEVVFIESAEDVRHTQH